MCSAGPSRRNYLVRDVDVRQIPREWIHWRGFLSTMQEVGEFRKTSLYFNQSPR